MLAVCGRARKATDARSAIRAASNGSQARSIRRARLGCSASSRGDSSCREVAAAIRTRGWFSRIRISSRAA